MRKDSRFFQHCDNLFNETETTSLHSCPLSPSHTHPASLSEHSAGNGLSAAEVKAPGRELFTSLISKDLAALNSQLLPQREEKCRQTVHCRSRRQLWCSVKMQTLWLMLQLFGNQTCTRQSKGNSSLVALVQAKSDLHLLKVTQ